MPSPAPQHKRQTLGRKLASLRVLNGLTQQQVADQIGVRQITISRIEQDRRRPNIDTLAKLARLYDASLDDLMDAEATHHAAA